MSITRRPTHTDFSKAFDVYKRCVLTSGQSPAPEEVEKALLGVASSFEPMLQRIRLYAHDTLRVSMLQTCSKMLGSLWAPQWEHVLWDHCSTLWNGGHFGAEAVWLERMTEQQLVDMYVMAIDADCWFHHPNMGDNISEVVAIPLAAWRKMAADQRERTRRITNNGG